MIIGVDHIALSCEDVDFATHQLEEAAFRLNFTHKNLPNLPPKSDFLKIYHPVHSIAHFQPQLGPALELTQHGAPLQDFPSPYQLLFGGTSPKTSLFDRQGTDWSPVWRAALGCVQPKTALWSGLHAQIWHDPLYAKPGQIYIRALLVPVADVALADRFWRVGLGCLPVAQGTGGIGGRWTHVAFRSPVPNWSLDVVLAESSPRLSLPLLDAAGFPCLGVLSTSVERDSQKLWQAGARESTGEFQLEINGKSVRLAILRGPDEELIELIEFNRHNE